MSKKNTKRTAAKKRRAVTKHAHMAPVKGGGWEGPSGRYWTQKIEPKGAALLAETLRPCHVVVKNHGAHDLRLVAAFGDLMDLAPGAVRATYADGAIRVENNGEEAAVIEFEIVPLIK